MQRALNARLGWCCIWLEHPRFTSKGMMWLYFLGFTKQVPLAKGSGTGTEQRLETIVAVKEKEESPASVVIPDYVLKTYGSNTGLRD